MRPTRLPMLAAVVVATVVLGPTVAATGETEAGQVVGASSNAGRLEKERRIRVCVNHARAVRGLALLRYDRDLARAARLHARNMRIQRFFDHDDPSGRGPVERVARFKPEYGDGVGENIGFGYTHSAAACGAWMSSPSHRANFLNPDYVAIGTGYTGGRRYWVQVFASAPVEDDEERGRPEVASSARVAAGG